MEVSGQLHAPVALLMGKSNQMSIGQEALLVVTPHKRGEFLVPAKNRTPILIQVVGPSPARYKRHRET
jgi:hypothetical protein